MEKENPIDFKYNFQIYWSFLSKYKFLLATIFTVILGVELLRVVDKFIFKKIIDEGTIFVAGELSSEAFVAILIGVAWIFAAATISRSVLGWLQIHLINKLEGGLIYHLKKKFFTHLLYLSHKFHTTHKTGSLIARLSRGAGAIERMTDFMLFNTLGLFLQVLVVGISLVYFEWITALVVVLTGIVFIGYTLIIQQAQNKAAAEENKAEDLEKAHVGDVFTNIESIKHYGKEEFIEGRNDELRSTTIRAMVRHWNYGRWLDSGHNIILGIGTFFLLLFPLLRFLNGNMTIGTLVFVYTVYTNLFGHLYGFVYGIRGFYRSMADFQDLFQYGKIENDIKDKEDAEECLIEKGEIEFRDVSFKYHDRPIFEKFNLKIRKNEKVALVGHSGSGKSTLVKLLYRLYDVDEGKILIDRKDIASFKQNSLRSELSIVPQECILFDDTVYNNILFSRPDAKREEVMDAMKFAQLDKVVADFPKKEQTLVGQRGVKLSGGEKQRVSIARAILANKKILVLDEATSSLDSQTEHEIQKDLARLLKDRTAIIIAHRLSTIMQADKIVVLDKGKIVQIGTHRQLINQRGLYKQLWNLQKGGYLRE